MTDGGSDMSLAVGLRNVEEGRSVVPMAGDECARGPYPGRPVGTVTGRRSAATVLAATRARWVQIDGLIWPLPGSVSCGHCDGDGVVVRYWQYHVRPGKPTIRYRCDVNVKCVGCAAGWWHGVALPRSWWDARRRTGTPAWLRRLTGREARIWNGDRGGQRA